MSQQQDPNEAIRQHIVNFLQNLPERSSQSVSQASTVTREVREANPAFTKEQFMQLDIERMVEHLKATYMKDMNLKRYELKGA